MAYRIAPFSMTLSDLQDHLPHFKPSPVRFLYNCVAVDKISTNSARPAAIAELLLLIVIVHAQK